MATIEFHKVSVLPSEPTPNAIYFVEAGDSAHAFIVTAGGQAKPIQAEATSFASFQVADDIAERDTLSGDAVFLVLVRDATDDPEVDSGAAMYTYHPEDGGYFELVVAYDEIDVQAAPEWSTTSW